MGIFGPPPRTPGITEAEFVFIRGELESAPFGHSEEKLTDIQVDDIMEDLKLETEAHTALEMKYGWKQVDTEQAAKIEANAANGKYAPSSCLRF